MAARDGPSSGALPCGTQANVGPGRLFVIIASVDVFFMAVAAADIAHRFLGAARSSAAGEAERKDGGGGGSCGSEEVVVEPAALKG